jgi:hypothetical protein
VGKGKLIGGETDLSEVIISNPISREGNIVGLGETEYLLANDIPKTPGSLQSESSVDYPKYKEKLLISRCNFAIYVTFSLIFLIGAAIMIYLILK